MTLGNNIKKYRKNLKLSQEDLALKSDLSRNAIYNYENDKRQPSIEILNNIAAALDVSINDLINGDTFDLTNSDAETTKLYLDVIVGNPGLKPLIEVFKNNGYGLNQEINGSDIYLIKDNKAIAKIPEKEFIDFGTRMLDMINEFTSFEFNRLIDNFTFLY